MNAVALLHAELNANKDNYCKTFNKFTILFMGKRDLQIHYYFLWQFKHDSREHYIYIKTYMYH